MSVSYFVPIVTLKNVTTGIRIVRQCYKSNNLRSFKTPYLGKPPNTLKIKLIMIIALQFEF